MPDEELQSILDKLNTGSGVPIVFTKPLGGNVERGKVFTEIPTPTDFITGAQTAGYHVYLVKDETKYVGIVLDMSSDLHWYMDPRHRGKGLMKLALLNYILPHLSQDRDEQRISISHDIDDYNASLALSKAVGFELTNESIRGHAELLHDLNLEPEYRNNYSPVTMSQERLNEIMREVYYYHRRLWMIYGECEMSLSNMIGLDDDFQKIITRVNTLRLMIQDQWLDLKDEEEEKLRSN